MNFYLRIALDSKVFEPR